ncbi:ANTAR domain-containing protein [Nocardioides aurantiacus]|uniref:ANTAR domain-containing protein n=1 Tax=Nocardioides aurantiacus TaxID=86796 RepID=UPI00403F2D11
MSSDNRRKKKKTKRRDNDPVRVYDDGRIAYWTGGRPGLGKRVHERCGTREAATARAAELRVLLARVNGLGAHAAGTLDEAMQDMVHAMRAAGDPEGRIRQYRSNWNKWVPAKIGATRCLDVDIKQWSAIFDSANAAGASASTVRNVARTLGVVTEWTVDRGYFASSEPFGDPRRRKKIVKRARKRAQINRAEAKCRYLLDTCPTLAEIEKYAAAFEEVYPGYGQRLVLLAFATGLRINELLALRHDSIDLETGEVHVDWQLDRYQAWPARRLPKGGKTRIALLWACYEDVASSLIADSLAVGRDDVEPIQQSVEVAKELSHPDAQAEDLLAGLESIAARVQEVVPDCVGLSLAWLNQGVTFTLVATDTEIAVLDALQYLAGGPGTQSPLDRSGPLHPPHPPHPLGGGRADPLATPGPADPHDPHDPLDEAAWHMYAIAGAAKNIRSTLTLPQMRDGEVVGTANLHGASVHAFEGHHQALADILDATAYGAVRNADLSFDTLQAARHSPQALADQDTINHAVGMMMSALGVTPAHAKDRLHEAAHRAGLTPAQLANSIKTLLGPR